MKGICVSLAVAIIAVCIIWGGYWVAKTVSYTLFYRSMVEETVVEMVRAEALK